MRKVTTLGVAALCMLCGIVACHRAESPGRVDRDIAEARAEQLRASTDPKP